MCERQRYKTARLTATWSKAARHAAPAFPPSFPHQAEPPARGMAVSGRTLFTAAFNKLQLVNEAQPCYLPQTFPTCSPNEQQTTLRSNNGVLGQERAGAQQASRHRKVPRPRRVEAIEIHRQELIHCLRTRCPSRERCGRCPGSGG
jgi:hypothetical protein